MIKTLCDDGEWFKTDSVSVFFGNKNSQKSSSTEVIQFGHQVHKDELLEVDRSFGESSHFLAESDGLWTKKSNLKLGVYTADCVPCFIYSAHKLFALHLGWRSLQLGLLENALKNIRSSDETQIFIGPHIQAASFEVGQDVLNKFKILMPDSKTQDWYEELSYMKFKISLNKVILHKVSSLRPKVYSSEIDTFTSANHCSYRRSNKTQVPNNGRNISFAFLN
jgi:copper oxidase (laccase) domain-containing protein